VSQAQKENAVRLPDVSWPIDLFTDVIMPVPKTVVALAAQTGVISWTAMVSAWAREDGAAIVKRTVPAIGSDRIDL
jgi:hypothetical protein